MKFSHENLAPKEAAIFLINYQLYSPAFFHNFHTYTLVTQLSKSVVKNLAYYGLLNFWNKHFMPL